MCGLHVSLEDLEVGQDAAAVAGDGLLGADHVAQPGAGLSAASHRGAGRQLLEWRQLLFLRGRSLMEVLVQLVVG